MSTEQLLILSCLAEAECQLTIIRHASANLNYNAHREDTRKAIEQARAGLKWLKDLYAE